MWSAFDGNLKGGAVFVDLTAAYATVWRWGLILKLLRMLPNRHMVRFISELISNHSVVVKTSDGQQSRLKRINNGVPQGSVLSPLLFNVYIADLPETNSKKYGYADDLALLKVHQDWNTIEETLTQDMSILSSWLRQWRLKLSEAKTVSSTFHLNNREAKRELNVNISGRRLTCHRTPTYLGVKLDRTLTYREHLTALRGKVMAWTALIRRLAGTSWGASTPTNVENVHPCTRVCTSGILCPGVVQKEPHSSCGCRPQCFPSHHNRVFAPYSGWSAPSTGWDRSTSFEAWSCNPGVRPSRVPTRSPTTRCNGKFHPPKETEVTSPSHPPCSTTGVLCLSTRDGETLHTSKVGWVVGIHHHETAQIHAHTIRVWVYPDEPGPD